MARKSHWMSVFVGSDNAKAAVKSWFEPLCEGMTPYEADVLCDAETDREKKMRARMTDPDGKKFEFVRTTGRRFTVTMKPLALPVGGKVMT